MSLMEPARCVAPGARQTLGHVPTAEYQFVGPVRREYVIAAARVGCAETAHTPAQHANVLSVTAAPRDAKDALRPCVSQVIAVTGRQNANGAGGKCASTAWTYTGTSARWTKDVATNSYWARLRWVKSCLEQFGLDGTGAGWL